MEPEGLEGTQKGDPSNLRVGIPSRACVPGRSELKLFRSSEAANFEITGGELPWDHGQWPEGTRKIGIVLSALPPAAVVGADRHALPCCTSIAPMDGVR